jgi:hypothetical protein
MARMKILTSHEEAEFESPPKFDSAERKRFFTISTAFEELLESPRTTATNKICFLVTLGYFKAQRKFFARQFIQSDIEFVANQVGINPLEVSIESYSKVTYLRHQELILRHFGYQAFTVISAAEREAAYVIDGLMHNEVVKSDIHSTDTHGYSEFVFGATFYCHHSTENRHCVTAV